MKKISYSLFLTAMLLIVQATFAQVSPVANYDKDPVTFLQQLNSTLFVTSWTKQAQKEYVEQFSARWNSAEYSPELKKATAEVLSAMSKKRLAVIPNYLIYLNTVSLFVDEKKSKEDFEAWNECVVKLLKQKRTRNLTTFLDASENLFLNNVLFTNKAVEYAVSAPNFKFSYDKQPIITLSDVDLKCYNSQKDSGVVYNTEGVFYPNTYTFEGKGGNVYWSKAGFEKDQVWADLNSYSVDLRKTRFTADSAILHYPDYFTETLVGQLDQKVISERGANISYPRFEVYANDMKIPELMKGIDYSGGIALKGPKLLGIAKDGGKAKLLFKRDGALFINASGERIVLSRTKLKADGIKFTMYVENDSITHPYLNFKYDPAKENITFIRMQKGLAKAPFLNSYHGINMYIEELNWKTKEALVELKMMSSNVSEGALFESTNFFRRDNYRSLRGLDIIKELKSLRLYVNKYNDSLRTFTGKEYAMFLKTSPKYILPTLIRLSGFGFLTYDGVVDEIHVNDKTFKYLGAYAEKEDSDVILFPSFTKGKTNATLDLNDFNLQLNGVREVFLSDSQNVSITPSEQKLILKKNRDFDFKGVINAGRFKIYGQGFEFAYDDFNINLNQADSVKMKVNSIEPDEYGNSPLRSLESVISDVKGTLQIDAPDNKAGLKPFSRYPIFTSTDNSYVYYDKKSIRKGVYPRETFYFDLDPFEIDSVDNFSNDGVSFEGAFHSGGVFPVFREVLTLQPDYSLGFVSETPEEGYAIYGEKATFTSSIVLNNNGLSGDGVLNYITSESTSDNFEFYPDSLNGTAQLYKVKEQRTAPPFPQVYGENLPLHFEPNEDFLNVNTTEDTSSFIESHTKQAGFNGLLTLSPTTLKGKGIANFGAGRLKAKEMKYLPDQIISDYASFTLESEEVSLKKALSFSTENIRADINFKKRQGEFRSIGVGSIVQFPIMKYKCFMQSFTWDMDNYDIEFGEVEAPKVAGGDANAGVEKDLDFKGIEFTSTHSRQDSLSFIAKTATFSPLKNLIAARNVEEINTADALVYPDSGNVFVERNAYMRPFENAKIAANSRTKLHNLYDCKVAIVGRKKYSGSGYYDYIDEQKKKQTFYFDNVNVDRNGETYAETKIPSSLKFKLSPYFEFNGKVKLEAAKTFLVFDGSTRISHKCRSVPPTWFLFEGEINPSDVYIPIVSNMKSNQVSSIASAFVVTTDSTHVYPAFASALRSKLDTQVLPADGFMHYDKTSKEYRISNKEKLIERSAQGNYLSLNSMNCNVQGEGMMNFGGDFGQVEISAYGQGNHDFRKKTTKFSTMLGFDFFFEKQSLDIMTKDINFFFGLDPIDYTTEVADKGLREFLGKTEAAKMINQLTLYNEIKKTPEALRKTLFFGDVKLIWNKDTRSFTSEGPIGLANIVKDQVNKYVEGKIEIKRKRGGDEINIYLQLDERKWYYFNYTGGYMLAVSSNEKFNESISSLKADKRKLVVKGADNYYFNLAPATMKTEFLTKKRSYDDDDDYDDE